MKKRILEISCMLLLLVLMIAGCSNGKDSGEYKIYYLSMDMTKTIETDVDFEEEQPQLLVEEMLTKLQEDPSGADVRRAIPENIKVGKPQISGNLVTIDLSKEYYELGIAERVLTRAAIVKTITQIDACQEVAFTVNREPMVNEDGSVIRSMNIDSFVENPGKQINSSDYTVLTLYFANKEGNGLVKEECEVHYSSNISLDKLVMTKLIEGPENSELQATLPSGTKIVMISVADGICYVNLDETFKNDQNNKIMEQIVLYSIVNSLTELPDVQKVQLSINGDSSGNLRFNYSLSELYERDDSLIVSSNADVVQLSTEEE